MVMHTLSSEFTLLRVVNGETVAAHNLGVTNGFVKPKLGRREQIFICVFLNKSKLSRNSDIQEVAKFNCNPNSVNIFLICDSKDAY